MKHFKINEVRVDAVDCKELLNCIEDTINTNSKLTISYVNANTINASYKEPGIKSLINSFDIVHPDGTGIYLASRYLFNKKGLHQRFSGSDFYPLLIKQGIQYSWRFYFFGHDNRTLDKIKEEHPGIIIAGTSEGYFYVSEKVIDNINKSGANILIVGLSFPSQERWVIENKDKLNCNIMFCVGDGIKVFANTKVRGPKFLQKLGLEWLVRVITNPIRYSKRYLIGNPLFIYRILKLKIGNLT